MLNRRNLLAFSALVFIPNLARAAAITPFNDDAFKAAQKDGKSILISIHADWCPTCRAQAPIIQGLIDTDKFKNLVTFRVDFDGQTDVVQGFGAQQQSTLITFKGKTETGRSVGETDPSAIEAFLAATV
jgi:thioredoxin 1